MPYPDADLRRKFPKLEWYGETSPPTHQYNCHAWAADSNAQWWQPTLPMPSAPWMPIYWPPGLRLGDYSLDAFRAAHGSVGFETCEDGSHQDGVEKIAHYILDGNVSHTARQLPWGSWTSKLGLGHDIEHRSPESLEGPEYGQVAGFMVRAVQAQLVPAQSNLSP